MDKDQESFLNELLNDFKVEAFEHYHAIVDGLIVLENTGDVAIQNVQIEKIFREVHSLKGASRAVNLLDIEKLCMNMETVFNSLKKGESTLFPPMYDVFHKATDLLNLLLTDVQHNRKNGGTYNLNEVSKNLDFALRNSLQLTSKKEAMPLASANNTGNEVEVKLASASNNTVQEVKIESAMPASSTKDQQTVRISTEKLSSLLLQSEELISLKSTYEYWADELQNMNYQCSIWNRKANERLQRTISGSDDKRLSDFYDLDKDFRKKHEEELARIIKGITQAQHISGRVIDELVHDIKTTLLFPFSSMLGVFPKIVRDLSKEYEKDIELVISGEDIEIDRRILEELKDPLIHLIRNCIDHGIESTNERIKKGKAPKGKIELNIRQNVDRKIEIYLKDDGAGLDTAKIKQSALKSGIIKPSEAEKLTDQEINFLIFHSGLSTSNFITTISGRGLGMAIVAEKVSKLSGSIDLKTTKDEGTTFILSLPQTLATFKGILLKIGEQSFIIPSFAVESAIRVKISELKTVESKKTICYKNEVIALSFLSDVLKSSTPKKKSKEDDFLHLLILVISQRKIALVVDEILGEQEGIVKDMGLQLPTVTNIAGVTIMGNGSVVPIINPIELLDTATQTSSTLDYSFEGSALTEDSAQKRILVAEDSITIRTLLRNFIENAGYFVKTAVDGLEAFEALQTDAFDLIVSDIEMPRMNGFELTAKIRENKLQADIPIILVTALETAEDKQRGMEVGANAYIVKSSFEKSNLIETIQRLI